MEIFDLIINTAWKYQFLTYPNPAVGAGLIVKNKLFISAHKKAGLPHAEVNALWKAFSFFHNTPNLKSAYKIHNYLIKNHNNFFKDAEVYVTLEPCSHIGKTPSCANLLKILKPKRVIIGTRDLIHTGGVEILKNAGIDVKVLNDKKSKDLIEPFIKWSKERFIFFKLAQSFNGVITGGYISNQKSLNWVHKVRDKIDLLIIGGNTVRVDRPTLDSRKVSGKAPDVLIYSKNKLFDKEIPLFKIKNRKVFIEDSLERVNDYKFIMIEGGENLYKELKNFVDWKVFILTPKIFDRINFKLEDKFEILHVNKNEDLIVFGR